MAIAACGRPLNSEDISKHSTPPPASTMTDFGVRTRSRANVRTPPAAPSSKRARLTNGDGIGRNEVEEEAEEAVEAEEDVAEEEEANAEDAEEEEVNGSVERAGDPMLTILVKDQTGEQTMFKIKRSTRFWKIMTCYALRKGVEATSLRFLLNGEQIVPDDTGATLQLEDGDRVDVSLEQRGC